MKLQLGKIADWKQPLLKIYELQSYKHSQESKKSNVL